MHPKELFNKKTGEPQIFVDEIPIKTIPDPVHFEDEASTIIDLTDIKKEPTPSEEIATENSFKNDELEIPEKVNHKKRCMNNNVNQPNFIVEKNEEETEANDKTLENPYNPRLDLEFYKYPTLNLLKKYDDQNTSVDMFSDVQKIRDSLDSTYFKNQSTVESKAKSLYAVHPEQAIEYLTNYSVETANSMLEHWIKLGEFMIVKYNDMVVKPEQNGIFKRTPEGLGAPVKNMGYPENTNQRIIKETGNKFLMP